MQAMKARLLISIVVAAVGAVIGARTPQDTGDPQSKIIQVEQAVEASFAPRVTYSGGESKATSLKRYKVKAADGRALEVELDRPPTDADLEPLLVPVASGGQLSQDRLPRELVQRLGNVRQISPGWDDLWPLWLQLKFGNKEIAEARAMLRYESKPEAVDDYDWNQRFVCAARSWQVEEANALRLKKARFAATGAVAGFVTAFVSLVVLAWLWRFVLDRVRELSNAFRGR
jgi:hypothetical protein